MHEQSMARDILRIIRGHISDGSEEGVALVRVEIGELAGILPETLEVSFRALVAATPFRDVRLEITPVSVSGCCNRCGTTSTMTLAAIVCPSCKSPDVTIVAGKELRVSEIVLREHAKGTP